MVAFKITEIRDFTQKLFIGDTFDLFEVSFAEFQTAYHFRLDGQLNPKYYDTEELKALREEGRELALWKEVKPLCFQIVKGRRTPVFFRIALSPTKKIPALEAVIDQIKGSGIVSGLGIRFEFSENGITGATGVSLSSFSPDRNPEYLWDESALSFLKSSQIMTEKL